MRFLSSAGESPVWRRGAEGMLRLLVLGLLAWYLVSVLRARSSAPAEAAAPPDLRQQLVRWSTVAAPTRVHVALEYPPQLVERDWLAALPGTGTAVQWSGRALVPTAVSMEPIADPAGGVDLAVAAPESAKVELRDPLGAFDTVTAGDHGVRVYLPNPASAVEAAVGPVVARVPLRDSLELRRLLLIAEAGWEAKFTQAALEERGWKVDAFLAFSPKGEGNIHQGKIGPIDTATYSAVLAIDTVAARYGDQIERYVKSGGGLVLWTSATKARNLILLAAGAVDKALPDEHLVPSDTNPRLALELEPTSTLQPDALILEQQKNHTAVAARRIGPGRVIQVGYVNSWRWRMAGADEYAADAHREWITRLVANVAYTSRQPLVPSTADVAPFATLVDRLGLPVAAESPHEAAGRIGAGIFALLALALTLEWASRRLRGVE